MKATPLFDARAIREALLARGGPLKGGFIRFAYRPFDTRWLYWEAGGGLLDRPRPDYRRHVLDRNLFLVTQQKPRRDWSPPQVISQIGCIDLIDRSATCIPSHLLSDDDLSTDDGTARRPNLSATSQRYLDNLRSPVKDLFHSVLAVLHDPAYREANAGALRMEWPRIPLPGWPDGNTEGAAEALARSAARGREVASLLDSDQPVPGVTQYALRTEIAALAVPATTTGGNMTREDFAVTACCFPHWLVRNPGSFPTLTPCRSGRRDEAKREGPVVFAGVAEFPRRGGGVARR